jgi:hypothetical protein
LAKICLDEIAPQLDETVFIDNPTLLIAQRSVSDISGIIHGEFTNRVSKYLLFALVSVGNKIEWVYLEQSGSSEVHCNVS